MFADDEARPSALKVANRLDAEQSMGYTDLKTSGTRRRNILHP